MVALSKQIPDHQQGEMAKKAVTDRVLATVGASRPRRSTKGNKRPMYRRRVKPPYSYAELITMAIKSSSSGRLTLREILNYMASEYPCFRGSYVGWKNSVRHNLSANDCFVKILRDTAKPYAKDNFWTIDARFLVSQTVTESAAGGASREAMPTLPVTGCGTDPSRRTESSATPYVHTSSSAAFYQPCPTRGYTPGHGSFDPVDDWSRQLRDLYVPDTDIDLSPYKKDLDLEASRQDFARDHPRTIKVEQPMYPDYDAIRSVQWRWHAHHPHGSTEQHRPLRTSPPASLTRTARIKSEFPDRQLEYSRPLCAGPDRHIVPGGRRHECNALGSIVASAIRGSLSLDLDESALEAIERSVRILDQTRPSDLTCS